MASSQPTHYATLGVSVEASLDEIKRRYRAIMREVHPDANTNDPAATRKAARVNAAYEVLSDPARRRAYDAETAPAADRRRRNRQYEAWAQEPDWEDVVVENIPEKRPAHKHAPAPAIEPPEIEVSMEELRASPRIRRTIKVSNPCSCTLKGDVSTSEPWIWGPIGAFTVASGATAEFEVEVIARKVTFPGLSRVQFVTREWTGTVPVRVTGYEPKARRHVRATESAFVPSRRRRTMRQF